MSRTARALEPAGPPRPSRRVRVLIVDDHRIFAGALGDRLRLEQDYEVVGIAHSSDGALSFIRSSRPDVVLLDYKLGEDTCVEVLAEIESTGGQVVAVVVSGVEDVQDIVAGLAAGAKAWVRKDTAYAELLVAMDEALGDRVWISGPLVGPVVRELLDRVTAPRSHQRTFVDDLSPRQLEVLAALLAGATRQEIADRFVLSPHTVRTHVQELLRRSGSSSTLELLAKARAAGAAHRLPF